MILLLININILIFPNSSLEFLNRILKTNENKVNKNYNRLSTGVKSLQDDPANYAIYEKMEAQIREMDKRINNDSDMLSYYTYMDAVLSGIIGSLQRIRELLVQKSSILFSDSDRKIIDNEISQCYNGIKYELNQAEFNKVKIFSELLNNNEFKNYFDNKKFYDFQNVDNLLNFIITQRSTTGSVMYRLENRIRKQAGKKENSIKFKSQKDTDYTSEISDLKRNSLLIMANILLL